MCVCMCICVCVCVCVSSYLVRVGGLVRATHLVAVVGEDVAEPRPALLRHRDRRAEVTFHLETHNRNKKQYF